MIKIKKFLAILSLFVFIETIFGGDTYKIDPSHAEIGFSVAHLVISKVKGHFNEFEGSLVLDENGKLSKAEATIQAKSIDTGLKKRDDHLRSPDFFSADEFPLITFKNVKVVKKGEKELMLGEFTIRDVTKKLELPFVLKGPIKDPWGNHKIGLEATATINRKDFGVAWNQKTETGAWVVGEEVELLINFEATKEK